jgi:3-oxoacyl-[acyl-carrier-protein] synthase II
MMHEKRRVVITGMGALSALGATTHDLWNGLLENRSGVRRVQHLVDSGITVTTGGEVDAVSPENAERDHAIANRAIDDSLAESQRAAAECGFVWSTGLDTFRLGPNGLVHRSAGRCFPIVRRGLQVRDA